MQTPIMQTFRWMRVPGDTVFFLGAVALVVFVAGLKTGHSFRKEAHHPVSSCDLETAVPDWLIEHPETLAVLQGLGIDYCCGGKSLEYACREQGHDPAANLGKLRSLIADGYKASSS